jgi:uncharacterized protein (TIGR03435 family)
MPLPFSRLGAPLVLGLACAAGLSAAPQDAPQPSAKTPAFEVVSIKPMRDCSPAGMRPILTPGHAEIGCVNTRTLIRLAYGTFTGAQMNARQLNVVGGPAWIDSDYYQLAAKTAAPAAAGDIVGPMFRAALEDRFKLRVHREPREISVYLLTVAEGKSNLQLPKNNDCVPLDVFSDPQNPGRPGPNTCGNVRQARKEELQAYDWTGVTMEEFVSRMPLDRPVVDKTGLTGRFNLHLEFAPLLPPGPVMLNGQMVTLPPQPADSGPSIFTAIQKQLGLKLTPGKAPIDVIVVDSIERPSEN